MRIFCVPSFLATDDDNLDGLGVMLTVDAIPVDNSLISLPTPADWPGGCIVIGPYFHWFFHSTRLIQIVVEPLLITGDLDTAVKMLRGAGWITWEEAVEREVANSDG